MADGRVRYDLSMDADLYRDFQKMAREEGTDMADIIRRGLAVMLVFSQARKRGHYHLGFVSDPKRLDVEMTGVL